MNARPTPWLNLGMALCVAVAVGCATSSFERGVFRNEYTRYRVGPVGPGWEQVSVDDTDVVFYARGKGTIAVNSTCQDYDDVPKAALLNHLLFGTERRVFRLEQDVTLDGRGARHALIDAELDGVPVTLEVYLLVKDGCVYDLSFVGARQAHARVQPEFQRFVAGFEVLPHD